MTKEYTLPVTVFMAAYNASSYIEKSIKSILNQSFPNFELLIVDDGSTDNTISVINSIDDPRIRLIENDKNRGLGYTRNIALKEAKGEYLAILDSDDIALPKRLEKQLEIFKKRPNLALLGSYAHIINKNGQRTGEKIFPNVGSKIIQATLLFSNTFAHSTVMMRTAVFRAMGGYPNHTVAQDYALFSRIALDYEVDNLPEYLAEYRIHDTNISLRKKDMVRGELIKITAYELEKLLPEFTNKDISVILDPITQSKQSLEDYYSTYSRILIHNRENKQYPIRELETILRNNWYTIVMDRGKSKTIFQLLRKPLFDLNFYTMKQIRKAFKKSLFSLISR